MVPRASTTRTECPACASVRAAARPLGPAPTTTASYRPAVAVVLVPYDLHQPATVAFAVELDEHHALPGTEEELAVADRHGLAGGPKQHRHAVGVSVTEVHVLGADVLCALVPVVMRVVSLAGDEAAEQLGEVLDEPGLELVHADAARRVRGVDARDALADPTLANGLVDFFGDVPRKSTRPFARVGSARASRASTPRTRRAASA